MNQPVNHSVTCYPIVHTNIAPNYNFVQAENAYLRQSVEYRDAVIVDQQRQIAGLQEENSRLQFDAARWNKFKQIIDSQKGDLTSSQLQNIVDKGDRNG